VRLTCLHLHREQSSRAHTQDITSHLAHLSLPLPWLSTHHPAGSATPNRVDTSTRREPSAFKRNTGYTMRGRGRGRGRARGGSLQTLSRGGSTQISSRDASQSTAQSD